MLVCLVVLPSAHVTAAYLRTRADHHCDRARAWVHSLQLSHSDETRECLVGRLTSQKRAISLRSKATLKALGSNLSPKVGRSAAGDLLASRDQRAPASVPRSTGPAASVRLPPANPIRIEEARPAWRPRF